MSIFKTIGDKVKSVIGKKAADNTKPEDRSPFEIQKTQILDDLDWNKEILGTVIWIYEHNPEVLKYIQQNLLIAKAPNETDAALYKMYSTYVKTLNSAAQRQESGGLLASVYAASKILLTDTESLSHNFDSLFGAGTTIGEVDLEQMKLSHAAVFGFINLTAILGDWFSFLLGEISAYSADNKDVLGRKYVRGLGYRIQFVNNSTEVVAKFVSDVLARGPSNGIMSVISGIKNAGDVLLYTEHAQLSDYADIKDYPALTSHLLGAFNPMVGILFVREQFVKWAHDRYQRKVVLRDWMTAKITLLRMDMQKMNPESPEYQKQLAIVQKYDDRLSQLDKKIADYERVDE